MTERQFGEGIWRWLSRLLYAMPLTAVIAVWWLWGYQAIAGHHVVATSIVGLAVVLPLLFWRTRVAAKQLETSIEIAATANKSRSASTFADGANMLGEAAPETRWAGINTLIQLVDDHPEYAERVVVMFCAFLRPEEESPNPATPGKSDEQKRRAFEAICRWSTDKERASEFDIDLRRIHIVGAAVEGTCLASAKLSGANLTITQARNVDFSGADFSRHPDNSHRFYSSFSTFRNCSFDGADLRGAEFCGVDLTGSTFVGADITGMTLRNGKPTAAHRRDGYPADATGRLVITSAQLGQAAGQDASENRPRVGEDVVDDSTGELLRERYMVAN